MKRIALIASTTALLATASQACDVGGAALEGGCAFIGAEVGGLPGAIAGAAAGSVIHTTIHDVIDSPDSIPGAGLQDSYPSLDALETDLQRMGIGVGGGSGGIGAELLNRTDQDFAE